MHKKTEKLTGINILNELVFMTGARADSDAPAERYADWDFFLLKSVDTNISSEIFN